jgi:hypothetical protein
MPADINSEKDSAQRQTPTPAYPIFGPHDGTVLKGVSFFKARKSNVVNFEAGSETAWRPAFPGSDLLCWDDKKGREDPINLCVIGRLNKANFSDAASEFRRDPAYRLELSLEAETATSLKAILDSGPLKSFNNINSPLIGRFAVFSATLKKLQKSDAPDLTAEDPFPFLFDGRDMAQGRTNVLKAYPAAKCSYNDLLAVETNISTYDIPARGDSSQRIGYSLSLLCVYFLSSDDKSSNQSSPKSLKRSGDSLVSPRKNKKPGHRAMFSDDE